MPPSLAARFTAGELAVLSVVAFEAAQHGACAISLAELGARSGCCRSLVRRAVRIAAGLGLITVEYRPRSGQRSLTNIIRIRDVSWLAWIARRGGSTKSSPSGTQIRKRAQERALRHPKRYPSTVDPAGSQHDTQRPWQGTAGLGLTGRGGARPG
jgi:hypothetical protein